MRVLARLDRLVTWRRARVYAALLCVLYGVAWGWVVFTGDPPVNRSGQPIAGDFIAFYTAGRLILQGQAAHVYDYAAVASTQMALLAGHTSGFFDAFRNPPFFALVFVPLGLLDLLPAAFAWFALSVGFLGVAVRLLLAEAPWLRARWRGLALLVFGFAPVYFGLIDGENATLSLLLFVLFYRAVAREQQVVAGLVAALGLFKPQLFVLFPFVLLALRMWRGSWSYMLTACVLAAVSFAVVGVEGLQAWVRILIEPETGNTQANAWRMASLKSFFDLLLPTGGGLTWALYAACFVAIFFGLVTVWHDASRPLPLKWIFTCLAAVLLDPHLVDYDLTVLVAAGVFLPSLPGLNKLWLVALYVSTVLRAGIPLVGESSLQVTTVILMAITYTAWRALTTDAALRRASPLTVGWTAS